MNVFTFINRLNIRLTEDQHFLEIEYKTGNKDALYDICDINGRIIKTGKIERRSMRVAVNDLLDSAYVFLVLDGEHVRTRRFTIER